MAGVYISYPFCAQKCTYCNFASGVFPRDLEERYVATVRAELSGVSWPWIPETVYLGGGTPSLVDPSVFLDLVPGRPWKEATIEAAPGSLTDDRVAAWTRAGIDRVSLGVQSFVQRELARTGRKHTADVVASDVAMLRAAGISSINIDLIAGLPGQTAGSWAESLSWIEKLDAPHASVYMLEVDEDSRLGQEILLGGKRYGASDVPSDDLIAEMYETAVERLARVGLARYEISNFARPGFESRHNLKYWKREPYLGFGADAHSFDGEWRWSNAESAAEYVAGGRARDRVAADAVGERFFLGLRLMEGIEGSAPFQDVVERFVRDGLMEMVGGRVRLTGRGVMVSNEVFAEFVGLGEDGGGNVGHGREDAVEADNVESGCSR
jgi:oxygen-independent coproporphyrinogen-3 oxidase